MNQGFPAMMRGRLAKACCSFLTAALAIASQAQAQSRGDAELTDGSFVSGSLVEVDAEGRLLVDSDGSVPRRIPLAEVHMIRLDAPPAAERVRPQAGVLLRRGDYLAVSVTGGDNERIVASHPLLGRLEIPLDFIRVLVPEPGEMPAAFDRFRAPSENDVVFRRQPDALGDDFIGGTVDLLSGEGITFACSLGVVTFGYAEVRAVVIAAMSETPAPLADGGAVALLRHGTGRISGRFKSLKGGVLVLEDCFQKEIGIPLSAAASVAFYPRGAVYLSDREPSERRETPYLGPEEDFLYPFRTDRSVTGQELRCAGHRFAKGLGVHSRCRLGYALDGGYSSFLAFVGLCDEVLDLQARGSIVFRVLVDGREVFESPVLRGGDPPVRIPPVPLQGARALTLEADFADGFDSGDRGFFGQAILVR